ncbi:DUF2334 domain-containing protein [Mycolicibacterium brumae]|uniref:DUF2334 domain-containing protein n=1 Tax=Mycolicibacterium brumae TaxID=85968 RepID=A0A2G5P4M8_9MYCO|nr:DUF2334 domain-containing protein [Mycolicibacterium brumae]MCV7192642.1 DUF2334 domain-containing protein [Mycolicibacterium brumae]PIB73080.1 DUF2334 domain-containing protein [Mycolicibacterium brumae]RWA16953.1 hypothetical protein MBRU_19010 [Mycolicibacterium brumae DSM 44177]UWW07413.1 DUF2334 domain-containing protein [Mycolicibacterium brumae]
MTGRLIVSVSGISDQTLPQVASFCDALSARGVPASLLVAPRLPGGYRLDADPETVDWLHSRRDGGDAVLLHGYDQAATKARRGEFAELGAHEAKLRLMAADRVLEHLGLRTRLFAAPGWAASHGAVKALPQCGFRLLAGPGEVSDLVRGRSDRGRVLGVGEGFLTDPWWCRLLVLSAERVAQRGGLARLNVSARRLPIPLVRKAMLSAVDVALQNGCEPAVYRWEAGRVARAA